MSEPARQVRPAHALPVADAEGGVARHRRSERAPGRRAGLGAAGAERLVPAALPQRFAGLLGQSPQGDAGRRPLPPPPHQSRPRLCHQGPLALSRARLGGDRGRLRLRAAGRDPYAGGAGRRRGDDHAVPGQRLDALCRPVGQADRLTRTSSPRSTCAASTTPRAVSARRMSISSFVRI